jgi:branched-chain amino acid transport system substrate-binding protein
MSISKKTTTHRIKRNVVFLSILFLSLLGGLSGCNQQQKTSSKEIKIACNLPLTGDLATYGVSVRDGANLALDDLKDSLKNNSTSLNFDFQDNQGAPKTTVSIFQNQMLKNPNIYISGVSPQTMSIIDQVSGKGIAHFAWVYAANICTKYPNTFRTWLNFNAEAEHYIDYAKSRKPNKVAIFYVNIEVCQYEFDSIVVPALHSMGVTDVMVEPYDIGNSDFKNLAAKAKSFKPDLILLNGFKGHMIQLVKDFRSYNLMADGNTMCSYDLLDAAPELSTEQLEGLRYTVPYFVINQNEPKIKAWRDEFRKRYNREPLYTDAYAYDMTYAIYYASKKVPSPVSNENVIKELLATQFIGITGPFKFTDKGDLILSLQTCYYQNGNLIPQSK